MFYTFGTAIKTWGNEEFREDGSLAAGYLRSGEVMTACQKLGFSESNAEACQSANLHFRSGVEVYDGYTFTELRIAEGKNSGEEDDCVALFIKDHLFLVVDVLDSDRSTEQKFQQSLRRFPVQSLTLEKLIYAFLDALVTGDPAILEGIRTELSELEGSVLRDAVDGDFNSSLLTLKNRLLRAHNYYEQLLDITEALEDNENDLFSSESLMYITNIGKKILRLREDVDSLSNSVDHLQDAYSSYLDMKLNKTMKFFTVITSIFFPLTIIVGWYGMNFQSMPEFTWRFGYLYVILLSVFVVLALVFLGRRKHWF